VLTAAIATVVVATAAASATIDDHVDVNACAATGPAAAAPLLHTSPTTTAAIATTAAAATAPRIEDAPAPPRESVLVFVDDGVDPRRTCRAKIRACIAREAPALSRWWREPSQ
jgi:hypothetical protein